MDSSEPTDALDFVAYENLRSCQLPKTGVGVEKLDDGRNF